MRIPSLSALTRLSIGTAGIGVRVPTAEPRADGLTVREKHVLLSVAALAALAPVTIGAVIFLPDSRDLVTEGQFWFMVHLTFGIMIVHGFAGGITTLATRRTSHFKEAVRLGSTALLALVSWFTVVSGTWFVYPGYRAHPADGAPVENYPQHYLEAHDKYFWHEFGMEWKEHVGWFTPILATAVAFVVYRYGDVILKHERIRIATTALFAIAFLAALLAAGLGAAINAVAPNDFLNQ